MRRRTNRLMGGGRTVLWDSFTDADGVPVAEHAPDGGFVWARQIGTTDPTIDTNRVVGASVSGGAVLIAMGGKRRRKNCEVSCDILKVGVTQGCAIGVSLRTGLPVNGNTPRWDLEVRHRLQATPAWQLLRRAATALGTVNQTLTLNQTYRVRLSARGGRLLVWIDDLLSLNVEAGETVKLSGIGLVVSSSAGQFDLRLDNWMVTR